MNNNLTSHYKWTYRFWVIAIGAWMSGTAWAQSIGLSELDTEAFFAFCHGHRSGASIVDGETSVSEAERIQIDKIVRNVLSDLEAFRSDALSRPIREGSPFYDHERRRILAEGHRQLVTTLTDPVRIALHRTLEQRYKARLVRWDESAGGESAAHSTGSRQLDSTVPLSLSGVSFYAMEDVYSSGGQIATRSSSWATGPNSLLWMPRVENAYGFKNNSVICGPWNKSAAPGTVAAAGCTAAPAVGTFEQRSTHVFVNNSTGERVPPYSAAIGAPPNGACGTDGKCYTTALVSASVNANGTSEQGKTKHYLYLKGTGQAVVTPSMADSRIQRDIVTWSGGQVGQNGTRVVGLSTPGNTVVVASIGSTEVGRVTVHVVDSTAPPPAVVNAPKTYSYGGYISPGSMYFGVTAYSINPADGIQAPTYSILTFFDQSRWVFRLGGIQH